MIEQDYPSDNLDDMESDFLEDHSALDEDSREEELDEQWDAQLGEEGEFTSPLRDCPSVQTDGNNREGRSGIGCLKAALPRRSDLSFEGWQKLVAPGSGD